MKLRINTKLRAALIAAISAVGFTTFGTGTLAVATGAALLAGQQAQANVDTYFVTFGNTTDTKPEWANILVNTNGANPKNEDLGNGVTLSCTIGGGKMWTDGTKTSVLEDWNTGAIDDMNNVLGTELVNTNFNNLCTSASGQMQRNTYTLRNSTDSNAFKDGDTITIYVGVSGKNNTPTGAYNVSGLASGYTVQYATASGSGFDNNVSWTSGTSGLTIVKITGTISGTSGVSFYSGDNSNRVGANFIAFKAVTPDISTYTWAATEPSDWTDNVWTKGAETEQQFVDGNDAVFDSTGYAQVAITTPVAARNVTVGGQNYTFALSDSGSLTVSALTVASNQLTIQGGAVTAGALTVENGATLSLTTGSNLSVTGGVTLTGSAGITVGTGSALKLGFANAGELLKTITGAGNITLTANTQLEGVTDQANPVKTLATGALTIDNCQLKLGKMNTGGAFVNYYVDMTSFSGINLNDGTLWVHTAPSTLKNLTASGTSTIYIQDQNDPQGTQYLTLAGTTTVNADSKLIFTGTWKAQSGIELLAGEGTLELNGPNPGIVNIGGGTIGQISVVNNNSTANITGNLTLGGLTGTKGTVNAAKDLTFTADSGEFSYTGTLTVGGQVVKTGAGTQTLGGFAINKTIDVQAGTLVLNGTYDITNLEMDPGVTYTYQNEQGQTAPEAVGGFRATSGSKTVYTKDASAIVTDGAATYKLDGKNVQLTDGKYIFSPEADLTELWVNGGTLSYDAYYAASGEETKALTTAKVAGGAVLEVGEHAVGTLEYQTNGSTIGLSGTGRVNAISGTGTLNLESGAVVTLGYAPTVASGQTFTTTGMGELVAEYIASTGGTATIGSRLHLTKANDRTKGLSVTNANGSIAINDDAAIDGSMYVSAGSVTIGGGRVEVGRIEFGDVGSAAASELTVNAGATLHVKGGDVSEDYHSTGLLLGEWEGVSTVNVQGNLYADLATAQVGDKQANLNIENGGVMAVKGVGINDAGSGKSGKDQIINLNLKDGGKLVLGASGITSNKTFNAEFGHAEVGMTADTTLAKDITLTSAEGTTFNTTKYKWVGEGAQLTLGTDTVGGTMTVSGNLSGSGKLIANGAGTLVLSGTNTHTGGTVVNGGTLKAASLGTGDITVNGGTLELTSSITTTGALTINDGSTLVFAGAEMLTAGSLAVSGTVTFDLSNVAATKAGTITLATATGDATGDFSGVTVNWALPESFSHGEVYVKDHSWVIDLISTGQALTWAGGTNNWSYDEADTSWLTPGDEPTPTHFTDKDSAVFRAALDPDVANIKEAISTAGVEVQAGADVTLQAAIGAETASLTPIELDIAGRLSTSVDVAATVVEATGADASWNITGGNVTADSITVAQDGKLALSGTGMTTGTVSGPGTVEVADGFTLTLSQQIDSDQATDLAILNNGTVAVALGSSQNVINMDAASTGTLEVTAGTISNQSALGANQTLKLNAGTIFAVKGGETAFASDIALAGNASMQLKDSANATFAGAVSGSGKTLSVSGGAANQTVTFTDTVTLGGLNVAGSGETIVFKGSGSNLGAIKATSGAFTIQFSKADGGETASYTFDTFAMSPDDHAATRWLIVDAGVTVNGTGDTLSEHATIMNSWGISGGGLEVNGTLNTVGVIGMDSGTNTSYLKGTGTINTKGLDLCNGNTSYIQGGITINITSGTGIYRRNAGNTSAIHLLDATLQAKDADWEFKTGGNNYTVTLDSASGTTFDAAANHTITLSKEMGGSGKLVKAGEGTVLVKGANTYSGGTAVKEGTLATTNDTALGTGNVDIAAAGTLEMRSNLTIAGDLTGSGAITYTGEADGTLSLTKQAEQNLAMDISAAGTGKLNLTLNGNSDYNFSGNVVVNNIAQSTNVTVSVLDEGDVTATGRVLTGRLVVGKTDAETDAVFTLSGEAAMLVTSGDATAHTYGNRVQGYGTFKLAGGATQTLTGDLKTDIGFHGTFWADGEGSVLTIDTANIYGDQVTFKATNGGKVVLSSSVDVKEAAVDNGTFDLNADVETLNVSGDNNTLNIGTGSVENINLGGNLTANGDLTIFSGNEGTKVTADAGKTLAVNGTANVDGRVQFTAAEDATVNVTNTGDNQAEYSLANKQMNVQAHTMEVIVLDNDVTVSNTLEVDEIVNDKGHKLTLSNAETLELKSMLIGEDSTVELLYTDQEVQKEGTVTITETLEAGGGTLLANLTIIGSTDEYGVDTTILDLDGAGEKALTLGSTLTMNTDDGLIGLDRYTLDALEALGLGETLTLVKAYEQTTLTYGEDGQASYDGMWFDAMFSRMANFTGDYRVVADGASFGLTKVSNTPEPTTGTLSLLALAALAARRRKH